MPTRDDPDRFFSTHGNIKRFVNSDERFQASYVCQVFDVKGTQYPIFSTLIIGARHEELETRHFGSESQAQVYILLSHAHTNTFGSLDMEVEDFQTLLDMFYASIPANLDPEAELIEREFAEAKAEFNAEQASSET